MKQKRVARFEVINHTADIGLAAYGEDVKEAFANAAYGMFSLIAELEDVTETLQREIEVSALDQEALLVAWLNELLYLFDVENIIFKRFEIRDLDANQLRATAYGEKFDSARHQLKMAIKATTYHMLKIEKDDGYRVQVILDV